jgi:hypothetical protein
MTVHFHANTQLGLMGLLLLVSGYIGVFSALLIKGSAANSMFPAEVRDWDAIFRLL